MTVSFEYKALWDEALTLSNQAVEVLIARSLNSEVATANLIRSLIVNHEAAVGMLQGRVSGQDGVVWLNNGGCVLGSGVDDEFELGFLSVIHGKTLHEQRTETGSSTTTEGVENQETLETSAVVCHPPDAVHNLVNHLLANSVVTTGIVV